MSSFALLIATATPIAAALAALKVRDDWLPWSSPAGDVSGAP